MKQVNFLSYLGSKRNLLIFWYCFHGLGLFVNSFNILGNVKSEKFSSDDTFIHVNLLTYKKYAYNEFWPFVSFVSDESISDMGKHHKYFNGIFYDYDISEFIFYSLFILVILYVIWNVKQKKKVEEPV